MKNISRIDNDRTNTHMFFARVYRYKWVGPRSFSDSVYGSRQAAERAAWTWWKIAEASLPLIPPKPVLRKATWKLRKDSSGTYYYVYLPLPAQRKRRGVGRVDFEEKSLYFQDSKTKDKQAGKAIDLVDKRNALLGQSYRLSLAAWVSDWKKKMQIIQKRWTKLKTMQIMENPNETIVQRPRDIAASQSGRARDDRSFSIQLWAAGDRASDDEPRA
jgi:hypothetical protein